jgi:indole-3-glycerol phosphate synthase
MTALVEVHNQTELERVLHLPGINLIGINNRDLTTFQVDLTTTQRLICQIQDQSLTVVSESGIFSPAHLQALQAWGIRAALVGEALVKAPDPGAALRQLLEVSP